MDKLVDARWLPPPEPLELTLAALETLAAGERVRLLIHREPHLLFDILRDWGYHYEPRVLDDGTWEIIIWRPAESEPKP